MKVAPSILTADFTKLKTEIKSIKTADFIHLDIMDGNFVPNLSFGPHISQMIRNTTSLPFDTHLMVLKPLEWIDKFALSNTTYITIHYESENYLEAIEKIKSKNIKVGLSIKPKTTIKEIKEILPLVDLVLVMSVEPGFGGQSFMSESLIKISELKKVRLENNLNFIIEVDGGINFETAKLVKEAGADMIVCGSFLFNSKNRKKVIKDLQNI